jgi:hypothetical protein
VYVSREYYSIASAYKNNGYAFYVAQEQVGFARTDEPPEILIENKDVVLFEDFGLYRYSFEIYDEDLENCDIEINSEKGLVDIAVVRDNSVVTLVLTSKEDVFGSDILTVEVSDGTYTSMEEINLTVVSVNDIPEFDVSDEINISEDFGEYNLSVGNIMDKDSEELTLFVNSENQKVYFHQREFNVDGMDSVIVPFYSKKDKNGEDILKIVLSDGENSLLKEIKINILPENDKPQLVLPSQIVRLPVDFKEYNLSFNAFDIDGDDLNITYEVNNSMVEAIASWQNPVTKESYSSFMPQPPNFPSLDGNFNTEGKFVLSLVPKSDIAGKVAVLIKASDGKEMTEKNITLEINNVFSLNYPSYSAKELNTTFEIVIYDYELNDADVQCDMGDGNIRTGKNFVYDYKESGEYNITCFVTKDDRNVSAVFPIKIYPFYQKFKKGWSFASLPTKGIFDYDKLYEVFGKNEIEYIFKYHGYWALWSKNNVDVALDKFLSLSSKEGFAIKTNNDVVVIYPLDENESAIDEIADFYEDGWYLIGVNEDKNTTSVEELIEQKSYRDVLMWKYNDGIWKYFTSNIFIDEYLREKGFDRFENVSKYDSFWVYVRKSEEAY